MVLDAQRLMIISTSDGKFKWRVVGNYAMLHQPYSKKILEGTGGPKSGVQSCRFVSCQLDVFFSAPFQ